MRLAAALPVILILGVASCTLFPRNRGPESYSPRLARVLDAADANRTALEKVLHHFSGDGEPLKCRAAEYLIENMEGKGYDLFVLCDSTGAEIDFNCLDYPDYESMVAVLDSIEAARGEIDFKHTETIDDIEVIEADYLIENIDLAFRAWREKPWARHLSFADFCAYVLPYRGSGEPLERWRRHFIDRYADVADRMRDPADPIEAARLINEEIRSWFGFDPRFYCHPVDQGLAEMLDQRLGRCEDMTNLAIYAMRANGLAVTSDYTPHWADTGNNHAWNAILNSEGRTIIFMGCEAHPGEYRLRHKMAKVYRKTFAEQSGTLASVKPEWEEVPRRLSGKSMIDVTADYTEVSDVTAALEALPPDSVNYAYLCVFNSGEWRAVDWGRIQDRLVTFADIGTDIAYLPAYYRHETLIPAGPPFILESGGDVRPLIPDMIDSGSMQLLSTTKRVELESTDGIEEASFEPGRTYQLFHWDGDWVLVGDQVAEGAPLEFDVVASGSLYWLVETDSRREERIFTYEDGVQTWW